MMTGLAAGTFMAAPATAYAPARSAGSARPRLIVFDRRFPQLGPISNAWSRETGAELVGCSSDIGRFWYTHLHGRWNASHAAIGGLTTASALFCLERLAWNAGQRVAWCRHVEAATDFGEPLRQWVIARRATALSAGERT